MIMGFGYSIALGLFLSIHMRLVLLNYTTLEDLAASIYYTNAFGDCPVRIATLPVAVWWCRFLTPIAAMATTSARRRPREECLRPRDQGKLLQRVRTRLEMVATASVFLRGGWSLLPTARVSVLHVAATCFLRLSFRSGAWQIVLHIFLFNSSRKDADSFTYTHKRHDTHRTSTLIVTVVLTRDAARLCPPSNHGRFTVPPARVLLSIYWGAQSPTFEAARAVALHMAYQPHLERLQGTRRDGLGRRNSHLAIIQRRMTNHSGEQRDAVPVITFGV